MEGAQVWFRASSSLPSPGKKKLTCCYLFNKAETPNLDGKERFARQGRGHPLPTNVQEQFELVGHEDFTNTNGSSTRGI